MKLDAKVKEVFLYGFFGGLTTAVNIASYYFLRFAFSVQISTMLAWLIAVLFAYITNKIFVFESKQETALLLLKEFLLFIAARIFSGIFEFSAMTILVKDDTEKQTEMIIKVIVTILVIVLNYVFSKLIVFAKKKES